MKNIGNCILHIFSEDLVSINKIKLWHRTFILVYIWYFYILESEIWAVKKLTQETYLQMTIYTRNMSYTNIKHLICGNHNISQTNSCIIRLLLTEYILVYYYIILYIYIIIIIMRPERNSPFRKPECSRESNWSTLWEHGLASTGSA
jgi:hypothetical protein